MLSRGKLLVSLACKQVENQEYQDLCDDVKISSDLKEIELLPNELPNLALSGNAVEDLAKPSTSNSSPIIVNQSDFDSDDSIADPNFVETESSSSEEGDEVNLYQNPSKETEVLENVQDKKATRWKKKDPSVWKYNVAKRRRSESLPYIVKNKIRQAKTPKGINCSTCRFKCNGNFSGEQRNVLCASYWKLADFKRQKDFLLNNITCTNPERRRQRNGNKPPRQNSKQYYFQKDGTKCRVCQSFFLKTLNISNDVVLNAFKYKGDTGTYVGEDMRGKSAPGNKTPPEVVACVKAHIESFPTVESHYSRASTKRQYLDCKLSISKMYALYKEKCEDESKQSVSFITYKRIFGKEYNLSFFKPKKDLCQICEHYNRATVEEKQKCEEAFQSHQIRKDECYAAKKSDKERAINENNFVSVTFDLQSVLQIPSSDVSQMYYCRKICVYNLTIYEAAPPNGAYCFCWTELNGRRGSSEIGSCLAEYLKNLPPHVTEVSLFSDTCGGQNRNQHVAALLLYLVQTTHLEVIEHKFLESGHSYMEVDSMHSSIEKEKKYVPVYTIQDWLNIFRLARSKRGRNKISAPYNVKELKFTEFKDLKSLSKILIKNKSKDEDGKVVNWLLIKSLKYSKGQPGIIQYKYNHSSEFKSVYVFGKGRPPALPKQHKQLYDKLLPISILKKQNLLNLCRAKKPGVPPVIPEEFHGWYNNLPTSSSAKDFAPEPSIEDSGTDDSDAEH